MPLTRLPADEFAAGIVAVAADARLDLRPPGRVRVDPEGDEACVCTWQDR
jgi:hypothetical protein